jgi:C4-type Zn-finger protein
LVKSEYGEIILKELGFEIPNKSRKAEISTVEGIFTKAYENLEAG